MFQFTHHKAFLGGHELHRSGADHIRLRTKHAVSCLYRHSFVYDLAIIYPKGCVLMRCGEHLLLFVEQRLFAGKHGLQFLIELLHSDPQWGIQQLNANRHIGIGPEMEAQHLLDLIVLRDPCKKFLIFVCGFNIATEHNP